MWTLRRLVTLELAERQDPDRTEVGSASIEQEPVYPFLAL